MREGLLWFDDDPRRRIDEKVQQAAARYRQKFGVAPDVCYVNPRQLAQSGNLESLEAGVNPRQLAHSGNPESLEAGVDDQAIDRAETRVGALRVLPASTVRPHHFWVGRAG